MSNHIPQKAPTLDGPLRLAARDWLDQRVIRRACQNSGINGKRLEDVRAGLDVMPIETLRAVLHSLLTKPAVMAEVSKVMAAREGRHTPAQHAVMLRRMTEQWRVSHENGVLRAAVVQELRLKAAN